MLSKILVDIGRPFDSAAGIVESEAAPHEECVEIDETVERCRVMRRLKERYEQHGHDGIVDRRESLPRRRKITRRRGRSARRYGRMLLRPTGAIREERTAPGSTVSFRDPTMSGSTGLSPHSHSYDPTNPLLRYSGASQVEQARLLVPPPHSGSVAACSVHTVVSLQVDPSGQASQHAAATQWRSFSAQHTVP